MGRKDGSWTYWHVPGSYRCSPPIPSSLLCHHVHQKNGWHGSSTSIIAYSLIGGLWNYPLLYTKDVSLHGTPNDTDFLMLARQQC